TLGCPDWTLEKIVSFAVENKYSAIEIRGIQRQMDVTKCKEFSPENIALTRRLLEDKGLSFVNLAVENKYSAIEIRGIQRQMDVTKCKEFSPENIALTRRLLEDKGLSFVNLGSSAEMHHSWAADRQKNLDEAKRFIDLAQKLNCPYVRVFPNKLPKDDRSATIDLIVKGLIEAGDQAKGSKVVE